MKQFILDNSYLFWDVKLDNISDVLILERVIDYGTLEQLKELFNILGEKEFKKAFVNNLMNGDKIKDRININDYKMIYLLAHRLKLNDKLPLQDIISKARKTSSYHLKS